MHAANSSLTWVIPSLALFAFGWRDAVHACLAIRDKACFTLVGDEVVSVLTFLANDRRGVCAVEAVVDNRITLPTLVGNQIVCLLTEGAGSWIFWQALQTCRVGTSH